MYLTRPRHPPHTTPSPTPPPPLPAPLTSGLHTSVSGTTVSQRSSEVAHAQGAPRWQGQPCIAIATAQEDQPVQAMETMTVTFNKSGLHCSEAGLSEEGPKDAN